MSLRAWPDVLILGHLENGVDGLLFGGIDKAAGVDDDHLGIAGLRRELVSAFSQMAHHHLCVDEVLGAAETYKSYFHG